MPDLLLKQNHVTRRAAFMDISGQEAVAHYGSVQAEYHVLRNTAGILDLSFRSRLCLLGSDRQKFLNGQVTNNVKDLRPGQGCYAALITAKGRMQSDLNIYCLEEEILLDFEPGLTAAVQQRLEKYIIADDVQIVDVAPHFGMLSVQGPRAAEVVQKLGFVENLPSEPMHFTHQKESVLGEVYLVNKPRLGTHGYDLFLPNENLELAWNQLLEAGKSIEASFVGWHAFEIARIEAGIPRFGVDMDETNLPPEAGLDAAAISYTKGCYIGQEVIARIRTYGQVSKALRGLILPDDLTVLPAKGEKLFKEGKDVGYITSSVKSPKLAKNIALGYVRREVNQPGADLILKSGSGESLVKVVALPFPLGTCGF